MARTLQTAIWYPSVKPLVSFAAQSIGEPVPADDAYVPYGRYRIGGGYHQGLPRVEELFEGRRPKNAAIIARMDGRVSIEEVNKTRNVVLTNSETGESETYMIPYNYKIKVRQGDEIQRGVRLTEGNVYPSDILNVLGPKAVQDYIIHEVQKVYRLQGVDINDKHIEVIVRQMLRKVKVEDSGSSYLLPGSLVDIKEIHAVNNALQERMDNGEEGLSFVTFCGTARYYQASSRLGKLPVRRFLPGNHQGAHRCCIRGKSDQLLGLKENVIIGKLIPAGNRYGRLQQCTGGQETRATPR